MADTQQGFSRKRIALAAALPFVACAVQWLLWDVISPFVWFLFFPTVFCSAWLGGMKGGGLATVIAAFLVVYFFIPPQRSLAVGNPANLYSVIMFLGMGYLFSLVFTQLHRARLRLQESNEQVSRLYEKSRELDTLKTRFFATVSHELRTPLALIVGPTSRLLANAAPGSQSRGDLEVIDRNARLLHRQVDDLLDVARLEAGRMVLLYAQVDLSLQVRMLASNFSLLAEERRIAYAVDVDGGIVAEVDPDKSGRIVLNLLSNAFKFTPEQGRVALTLRRDGDAAVLTVGDSGPGIPADQREVAFEAFRQLDGAANRRHGGSGLGLAIVREFITLHGGSVAIGDNAGGGALFTVRLPLVAPAGCIVATAGAAAGVDEYGRQVAAELREAAEPGDGERVAPDDRDSRPLVLVVEDNPDMSRFTCSVLQEHFRVRTARDGREGLQMAIACRPDLILTDIMMPGISGDTMVGELRRHRDLADTPIIVLTAKADDELQVRLLSEGVRDYIRKPYLTEDLLARVSSVLALRRQAEQSLQVSEERFRALFEQMLEGFALCRMIFDGETPVDFEYLAVNPAFHAMTGLGDVVGRRVTEVIPGVREMDPALFDIYGRVSRGAPPERFEMHLKALDMWFSVAVYSPMAGHFVAVFDVITERKLAEERLKEVASRLELATASASLGVWDWNVVDNHMYWDERMMAMYGYDHDDFPGGIDAWRGCLHPDDADKVWSRCQEALLGTRVWDLVFRIVRRDGSVRHVKANGIVQYAPDGTALRMLGVNQDITEQMQLEDQLAVARKMEAIGLLAGGVAHDFNNKLTVILGYAELLKLSATTRDGAVQDTLDEIIKAGEQSREITRQLLAFSRQDVVRTQVLDLAAILEGTRRTLGRLIGENIRLEFRTDGELWDIAMDATQLDQVIMNLAINARDAMPAGGKLTIAAANCVLDRAALRDHPDVPPGDFVRLSFHDTGVGMDEATRRRVFEPFFTTKELGKGTGLGLATVYGIVTRCGGFISVSSVVGESSTFDIHFPRHVGEQVAAEPTSTDLTAGAGAILLVEDELAVRKLTAAMLDKLGYTLAGEAATPEEALRICGESGRRVDIVLTDVIMPGMSGVEMFERIKAMIPGVKVLYMSGYTSSRLPSLGPGDTPFEFIQKPFGLADLSESLKRLAG